jgi:hypothetical protein
VGRGAGLMVAAAGENQHEDADEGAGEGGVA